MWFAGIEQQCSAIAAALRRLLIVKREGQNTRGYSRAFPSAQDRDSERWENIKRLPGSRGNI